MVGWQVPGQQENDSHSNKDSDPRPKWRVPIRHVRPWDCAVCHCLCESAGCVRRVFHLTTPYPEAPPGPHICWQSALTPCYISSPWVCKAGVITSPKMALSLLYNRLSWSPHSSHLCLLRAGIISVHRMPGSSQCSPFEKFQSYKKITISM